MKYIYARTSTTDQNVDQQADALLKVWSDAIVFKEQVSGKTMEREALEELRHVLQAGDSILVLSVSRLGRTTTGVLEFIEEMKQREVSVHVQDLGMIDVTSPMGKLVLTTLAAVAEMQREEILEKQRIGIERAKAEGRYKGKQQSEATVKKCKAAMADIEKGFSKEKAAKANNIGIATLYRYIKDQTK